MRDCAGLITTVVCTEEYNIETVVCSYDTVPFSKYLVLLILIYFSKCIKCINKLDLLFGKRKCIPICILYINVE